jgi:flagellar hook-associated protein 2
VTLTIGNNTTGVKEALQEFVEAYNTLRSYLDQNQSVTDGAASSSAYLYGESLMRSMNQTLARILPLSYGDGDYNSLGSFGITLNTDNHLEIDETALDAALGNHFSEVVDFLANGSGFADTMYDMLNGYAGDNGTIADRVSQLQTENSDLTSRSDTIKEAANAYETMLIERYSKMEVQIQTANIIKRQIEALLNGSNDND